MLTAKINLSQIFRKDTKGFTLVELMVVLSIIAILSVVGIVLYSGAQIKARDSIRKNDLNNIATALELYKQSSTTLQYVIGNNIYVASMQAFMNSIPDDPKGGPYYYNSLDGSTYSLCAKLENLSDSDLNNLCTDNSYNYGVIPK